MGDTEYIPEGADPVVTLLNAGAELAGLMEGLAAFRVENPTDDLTSELLHANVDGESLTHQELASFFILLLVAGNETTRNAISHGLWALTEHPDQRAALDGRRRRGDPDGGRRDRALGHARSSSCGGR